MKPAVIDQLRKESRLDYIILAVAFAVWTILFFTISHESQYFGLSILFVGILAGQAGVRRRIIALLEETDDKK